MPDRTQVKIGDRIRLLRIPQGDLEQRECELRAGAEDAGWTADTIASPASSPDSLITPALFSQPCSRPPAGEKREGLV
jgi:hypothetical protein